MSFSLIKMIVGVIGLLLSVIFIIITVKTPIEKRRHGSNKLQKFKRDKNNKTIKNLEKNNFSESLEKDKEILSLQVENTELLEESGELFGENTELLEDNEEFLEQDTELLR